MRIALWLVYLAFGWALGLIVFASSAFAAPPPSPRAQPRATVPAAAPPGARPVAPVVPTPPPLPPLAPIDLAKVPEACQPLAKQAVAQARPAALAARISLASCMAEHAIATLELCDCGASIAAIDAAAVPAIALLDDVISAGDPAIQVIAEHAEGQLYAGFPVRLLATLPKVAADAGEAEVTLREMRRQTLEAQLAPWREAAMASFQHVVELARAHRELTGNPAVASAVRDSEQQLAASVATR